MSGDTVTPRFRVSMYTVHDDKYLGTFYSLDEAAVYAHDVARAYPTETHVVLRLEDDGPYIDPSDPVYKTRVAQAQMWLQSQNKACQLS